MSICTVGELIAHLTLRVHELRSEAEELQADDALRVIYEKQLEAFQEAISAAEALKANMLPPTPRVHQHEVLASGVRGELDPQVTGFMYNYSVHLHLEGGGALVLDCKSLDDAAEVQEALDNGSVWGVRYHEAPINDREQE